MATNIKMNPSNMNVYREAGKAFGSIKLGWEDISGYSSQASKLYSQLMSDLTEFKVLDKYYREYLKMQNLDAAGTKGVLDSITSMLQSYRANEKDLPGNMASFLRNNKQYTAEDFSKSKNILAKMIQQQNTTSGSTAFLDLTNRYMTAKAKLQVSTSDNLLFTQKIVNEKLGKNIKDLIVLHGTENNSPYIKSLNLLTDVGLKEMYQNINLTGISINEEKQLVMKARSGKQSISMLEEMMKNPLYGQQISLENNDVNRYWKLAANRKSPDGKRQLQNNGIELERFMNIYTTGDRNIYFDSNAVIDQISSESYLFKGDLLPKEFKIFQNPMTQQLFLDQNSGQNLEELYQEVQVKALTEGSSFNIARLTTVAQGTSIFANKKNFHTALGSLIENEQYRKGVDVYDRINQSIKTSGIFQALQDLGIDTGDTFDENGELTDDGFGEFLEEYT